MQLFKSLSPELNEQIIRSGVQRNFAESAVIFSKGDSAEFLPVVISGRVKMVRFPEPGKEIIVGIFGAGEVFAIPPALDGKQFPASAIAMIDSHLLIIPRAKFLSLKDEYPEFSSFILERMCGLLREHSKTIEILATSSAEQRVAATLLKIAATSPSNGIIKITHRRQDIAEMSGLTIESTIRSIRRMAQKGIFEIVHGKIHIADLDRLERSIH